MTDPDPSAIGRALLGSGLALALDRLTEPWSNAILRASFLGVRQFEGFLQVLAIPRQTLSLRLAQLGRIGLLERREGSTPAARSGYRLTAAGRQLYANVLASWAWDRRWGDCPSYLPAHLRHLPCGHAMRPTLVCEHCGVPLTSRSVTPVLRADTGADIARPRRSHRWRHGGGGILQPQRDILAVIDDRWSVLLVAAIMAGLSRFDDFRAALAISTAVLAQRLQRLCELQLLQRLTDPDDARRARYRLATSGRDLLGYLLTLHAWGQALAATPSALQWRHQPCDQICSGRMACSCCTDTLLPEQVTWNASLPPAAAGEAAALAAASSRVQPRKRRRVSASATQKLPTA